VLALTYILIKPLLWLVDKAGYSDHLWAAVGRKMREKLVAGNDFGTTEGFDTADLQEAKGLLDELG